MFYLSTREWMGVSPIIMLSFGGLLKGLLTKEDGPAMGETYNAVLWKPAMHFHFLSISTQVEQTSMYNFTSHMRRVTGTSPSLKRTFARKRYFYDRADTSAIPPTYTNKYFSNADEIEKNIMSALKQRFSFYVPSIGRCALSRYVSSRQYFYKDMSWICCGPVCY